MWLKLNQTNIYISTLVKQKKNQVTAVPANGTDQVRAPERWINCDFVGASAGGQSDFNYPTRPAAPFLIESERH